MNKNVKINALRRLKIIEGQVRGLQKMAQNEKYCIDILHQLLAVKEGLSGVGNLILENHLSTHMVEQIKNGSSAKAVKEILSIYKLTRRQSQ